MRAEMNRDRVIGFLDTRGTKIVNGNGDEVLLTGWGLGNWLLPEGYMWLSHGADRFDRPRRIEAVIGELVGEAYATGFWSEFRKHYITEADIRLMAEQGYNSVRIPLNARLFLQEGPGLHWQEEGFQLLDRCLDWCETHRLYAFLDLHGAPGGQTGANIDDSIDDEARLFLDADCFHKGISLWEKLAIRYRDRWIVGGYDLLNEPLRPVRFAGDSDQDIYLPLLKSFYEKAIAAIRRVDARHVITVEGHHWATALDVFDRPYDEKMIIHFHRYGCLPDISSYREFLELSARMNQPLWLGETGENRLEWYAAMFPLAEELGIGYNLWPWKKMACINSPCSIVAPEGWEELIAYAKGGRHPGYERAQRILDAYLENIRVANCRISESVTAHVFRTPGCVLRATDFDEFPGRGLSFSGLREPANEYGYRNGTGMGIVERHPEAGNLHGFDSRWNRFVLSLTPGEFACYTVYGIVDQTRLEIHAFGLEPTEIEISQDNQVLDRFSLGKVAAEQVISGLRLRRADRSVIRITVLTGHAEIDAISVGCAHREHQAGQ